MSLRCFNAVLIGLVVMAISSNGEVISDFESPLYTTGNSIGGVDGWIEDSPQSIVYPDAGSGLVPPVYPPLEGGQSVYSLGHYRKPFDAAESNVLQNGAVLSFRVRVEANLTGQTWFFLRDDLATGSTPAGIILNDADNRIHLSGNSDVATSYFFTNATTYLVEMHLNFLNDEFGAYATDISNGGPRTWLGIVPFSMDLDPVSVGSIGGISITRFSGSAAMWDAIELNPLMLPAGQNFADFEPLVYTGAADIAGVDGWVANAFGPAGVVTPDPFPPGSGYMIVMDGLQSYVLYGGASPGASYIKAFPPGMQFNDDSVLSWLMWTEVTSNVGNLFLLPDVAGGANPAGAGHNNAGNFVLWGGGELDTGVAMAAHRVYLMEMEFDWPNSQYTAYVTDIFNGSARALLGVRPIVGVTLDDFTDGDGGISLWRAGGATAYDRIVLSAGTVPLSVSGISADAGAQEVVITWGSEPGQSYTVRRAGDPTSGFTNELASGMVAGAVSSTYTDDVTGVDAANYRVEQE